MVNFEHEQKIQNGELEETLNQTIRLAEALPPQHLVRFVIKIIVQLDLSKIYERYAPVGRGAIAPEILLGLLFYGYATGLFSSRKIEKATYESILFRYIAGGLHPDHDTIANFRKTFLAEIQELFVQILRLCQEAGMVSLGHAMYIGLGAYSVGILAELGMTSGWLHMAVALLFDPAIQKGRGAIKATRNKPW